MSATEFPNADWDVIVIGAGPAGCMAARRLSELGRRVLLVEQRKFPRRKVCGGCVGETAVSVLRSIGLYERVRDIAGPTLHSFQVAGRGGALQLELPGGLAISRGRLDEELVRSTVEKGVEFRDHTQAEVVTSDNDEDRPRSVRLNGDLASAKVVIACDGLNRSSTAGFADFKRNVDADSRIGVGCEVEHVLPGIAPGTIHMAIGQQGYVGFVEVEQDRTNVAAAIRPEAISKMGSIANVIRSILRESRMMSQFEPSEFAWSGTPLLSHSTSICARNRLLMAGDSAGYIEPFTGEGIGWAMLSGIAAAEFAHRTCDRWCAAQIGEWSKILASTVGGRQTWCRLLASLLRWPTLANAALWAAAWTPHAWQPIVRRIQTSKVCHLV